MFFESLIFHLLFSVGLAMMGFHFLSAGTQKALTPPVRSFLKDRISHPLPSSAFGFSLGGILQESFFPLIAELLEVKGISRLYAALSLAWANAGMTVILFVLVFESSDLMMAESILIHYFTYLT